MHCPTRRQGRLLSRLGDRRVYFVHSYRATPSPENKDWVLSTSSYGGDFISSVQKGEVAATQVRHQPKTKAFAMASTLSVSTSTLSIQFW